MIRALTFLAVFLSGLSAAVAQPTVMVLGDSLAAGLGLAPPDAFPARLEAALQAKGLDVKVLNAGVSGDTAADGLARLDWALDPSVTAVIVELGANDALRGLPVPQMEAALDGILTALDGKQLPVLIAGMKAPRNLGPDYAAGFDPAFARLAEKHRALLYPFYLDGVAADPALNQADGMHPNAAGVAVIVSRMLPVVEQLLQKAGAK